MAEMPELHIQATKIVRAFKPGDIVFIECDSPMSEKVATKLQDLVAEHCPDIKVIVLGQGMKLAGREEIVDISASSA